MGLDLKPLLPDTNVLILALLGQEPAASWLREAIISKRLVLSAVVVAEFLVRAKETDQAIIAKLCRQFPVLAVDLEVAQKAAQYRRKFLLRRQKMHLPDCFIAAQCLLHGAQLATYNRKDYPLDRAHLSFLKV